MVLLLPNVGFELVAPKVRFGCDPNEGDLVCPNKLFPVLVLVLY
ncbi:GSCOCG00010158001-RA-CDS [Cotesia congregata]|nr:GSCOCG00010158001-RA-CDS [Cotesia congregata]